MVGFDSCILPENAALEIRHEEDISDKEASSEDTEDDTDRLSGSEFF